MTTGNRPLLPPPETLPLAQMVAQMVVVRTTGHLFDHEIAYPAWEANNADLQDYVAELGVGGIILLGASAAEVGVRSQQLQMMATIPLLMAADIEEGVGQRFSGATWFPPPMALGAIAEGDLTTALDYATRMGAATAQEALAIGLNWVLAPVVDVNNNPKNPVINVRAMGQTPGIVAELAAAFIRGAQDYAVLTTAKHFPGHGDTASDSHLELPMVPHDWERLQQVELSPFQQAIAQGVDAVMTAHLQVPALDPEYPATLSPKILTDLLRRQLGFDGLIVTDALVMGAITRNYGPYEAAVLAVEAGADVLLMPGDPEGVIRAICEAIAIGRLSAERIQASVERLWRAKQKAMALLTVPPESCHAWEHIPPPPVRLEQLATPPARAAAAAILRESMAVRGQILVTPPANQDASAQHNSAQHNIVVVDSVIGCRFLPRTAPAIAIPQELGYHLRLIDNDGCQQWPVDKELQPSVLQLFIRGNPFRGSAAISTVAQAWFQALLDSGNLVGLLVYGSPYALEQFQSHLPAAMPYGFTYGQMPAAQTLLWQALLGRATAAPTPNQIFTD